MKKRKSIIIIFALCILSCMVGLLSCSSPTVNTENTPSGLVVLADEYKLEVGASQNILVTYNEGETITYESQNTDVVTVDTDGKLTGVAAGIAYVEVNADDKTVMCKVSVTLSEYSITIGYSNVNLVVGSDIHFNAQLLKNGVEYDGSVNWSVSSSDKCTFVSSENSATFTATEVGNFIVTATSDKTSTTCNVKVVSVAAKKLDTPVLSIENCDKIKWTTPTGANSYAISVNGSDWAELTATEYSVDELSDGLAYEEKIIVKVKALSKGDYAYIDSYIASVEIQHDYTLEELELASCTVSGVVKFTCKNCSRTYTDNEYCYPHVFEENICTTCNQERTAALLYLYDAEYNNGEGCYYVAGVKDRDASVIYVSGYYDDGLHGKKEVKYLGVQCFYANTGITHLILPETIEVLYDLCFRNMQDLEYIYMPGVSRISEYYFGKPTVPDYTGMTDEEKAEAQEAYKLALQEARTGMNQFVNCLKLKTVIIKKDLVLETQALAHNQSGTREPIAQLYVMEKGGKITTGSYNVNLMQTEKDGSLRRLYYDANGKCGTWHFAEDGYTVVVADAEHLYDEYGYCFKCGSVDTKGIAYDYDTTNNCYYVSGVQKGYAFEVNANGDVVVEIFDKYDDGVHGELPVKYLGENCFKNNKTITHLILPECVTELKPWCCMDMSALKYVYMPGVTSTAYATDSNGTKLDGNTLQFRRCNLEGIVVKDLYVNSRICFAEDITQANHTKVYVVEGGSGITFADSGWMDSNNNFEQVSGAVPSVVYDTSGKCKTWHYAEDGYTVVVLEHNYVDGYCAKCGSYDVKDVVYAYDATADCYYVSGIQKDYTFEANANGDVVLRILGTYNDGAHGEKAVKYLGENALRYSTNTTSQYHIPVLATITHLILPESVDTLKLACCQGMSALQYVYMPGVSLLTSDETSAYYGTVQFRYCTALATVIVKKDLRVRGNAFLNCTDNSIQIYVEEAGGTVWFGSVSADAGYRNDNLAIISTAGVAEIPTLVKDVDWAYAADEYTIVLK